MVVRQMLTNLRIQIARGNLAIVALAGVALVMGLISPMPVAASLSIDEPSIFFTVDFSSFTGSGFAPEPVAGQLDSDTVRIAGLSDGDLSFGGTNTIGDYARGMSTGNVGPAGIYAFEVTPGVVTLGIKPSNADYTPGEIVLRILNNTTDRITDLHVGYNLWVNNNQSYSTTWSFHHSADDQTYNYAGGDYTSCEAADAFGWQMKTFQLDLTGLSIEHGEYYYLEWVSDDATGHGQRDEFGLNNITVSATVENVNYPPVAFDDSATTPEDTSVTIDVLFNDSDLDGDTLLLDSFTQPTNGSVIRDDKVTPGDTFDDQLTYTPEADWSGIDSFTYTVDDQNGETDTAIVHVTVEATYPYTNYLPLIIR